MIIYESNTWLEKGEREKSSMCDLLPSEEEYTWVRVLPDNYYTFIQ